MLKDLPLITVFGRTHRYLNDAFELCLQQEGLSLSVIEFALLYRLSTIADDEITQQNFANMEGKHKSVVMRQLEGLEQKSWITRVSDTVDRRKNMVSLTSAGISVLNKALVIEAEMTGKLLDDITPNDLDIFKRVALQLQRNLLG